MEESAQKHGGECPLYILILKKQKNRERKAKIVTEKKFLTEY